MQPNSLNNILRILGPGLLFAGAAIGVSHLVQSTRAGANYGFELLWAVLVINILKYPFFEYGPRYVAATGETLLDGYKRIGNWVLGIFLLMTFGTMFAIQAAVTIVTAGIASQLFPIEWLNPVLWSAVILGICLIILIGGRYKLLDSVMKVIMAMLAVTTLIAVIAALSYHSPQQDVFNTNIFRWEREGIVFLIALMGWMPAPFDLSVWSSVWSQEKARVEGQEAVLKESLFDFRIGYWGAMLLAICFLTLGALIMLPSGEELSGKGPVFAGQLINIYTESLGQWAYLVISIATLTTMFSTTLTCLDAFPRVLSKTFTLIIPNLSLDQHFRPMYWGWILFVALGAIILLAFLKGHMGTMVDIATVLSFLLAPVFAIFNFLVITDKHVPYNFRPKGILYYMSWVGIVFLIVFSVIFLIFQLK